MHINLSIIEIIKKVIFSNEHIKNYYLKSSPNSKYTLDDILEGILYVLKTGIAWRDSKSCVKWNSLYFHFQRFVKYDIFKHTFLNLRSTLSQKTQFGVKLVDSSFILNKFGKNCIGRNKYFKNKNCTKLSFMTDENGIPLSILVKSGNVHDITFVEEHINDLVLFDKNSKTKKTTLLADKAYESKNLRSTLKLKNYSTMIPKKINAKTTYPFDDVLYKKRIKVEHAFQRIKTFRRIANRYDSLITSYLAFVYLASSILIIKNI